MTGFYDDIAAQEAATRRAAPPLLVDDTYDAMAASVAARRDDALKAAIGIATRADPVKAGKIRTLADQTGLPVPVVERNEDVVGAQQRARDLYNAMEANPILKRQMLDPEFAKIAQDDLLKLSPISQAIRFPWRATQGVASGLPALSGGLYGLLAMPFEVVGQAAQPLVGKLLPENIFAKVGAGLRAASANQAGYAKQVADVPKDAGLVHSAVLSGFQSLGQNLPLMIAALYTGNPAPALTAMSGAAGGQSYTKGRETLPPIAAARYGMTDAAIEFLTEKAPLFQLVGQLRAGTPFLKAMMHNQVSEQLGEQAATVMQDYNEWITLHPEKPFVEYLKERPSAALQTAIATVIGSGGQVAVLHAAATSAGGRAGAMDVAARDAEAMKQLLSNAGASLLRERSPTTFAQFVNDAATEGPVEAVFVHAATFQQAAAEAGIDIAAAMPETAAAMQDALASDTDVRIPMGELATAIPGTKLEQSIIPHLRTDPHGPTQAETQDKAWVEETQKQTEKILASHEFDSAWKQSAAVVEQELTAQLTTVKRFTADVNKAYAGFMAAFYATQAHRLGITPEEMYKRYPLRIQAESPVQGEGTLAQPVNIPGILQRHVAAGGGTWDLITGEAVPAGFAVAAFKEREEVIEGHPTPEQVAAYVEKNRDLLSRPGNHLGTWFNAEEGKTYLDISAVAPDLRTALRVGQRTKQKAVYDIVGANEVKVPAFSTAQQAAVDYMEQAGLPYNPPVLDARVNVARAQRIAQAYEDMVHAPDDPQVAAAYAALIAETQAQWEVIRKTGLKVEFIKGQVDPYAKTPRMAIDDINQNNHLWVFPTDSGFGNPEDDLQGNPLLALTGETIDGRQVVANDIFRIVHDYFGHAKDNNGFRANGEENAWRSHSAMYTPLARRAMTSETRGQNSWVNFGPFGEANRTASTADTHYAPQKTGLLPEWVSEEGADDAATFQQSGRVKNVTPAIRNFLRHLKPAERNKVTDKLAERILAHLKNLPSANEMAAIAHAGRAKRGWYSESAKAISAVFGPEAPNFAMLLAATSPQIDVAGNLTIALNVWNKWVNEGRPRDTESIVRILHASAKAGEDSVMLHSRINNSVRALSYDDVLNVALSGPKVESFYRNLIDEVNEVTLDTWMANYALVDSAMFSGSQQKFGEVSKKVKGSGYLAYSARVREAAAALSKATGETWTPSEVQETIWSWAKTLYELAESTGTTAVENLKAGTLTNSLIASTPDFGSLFNEPQYAAIFKEAGYADELDSLRGTRDATQRQPGEDAEPEGKTNPFTSETQRRYELAAARRLDRLKGIREAGGQLAQSGFHGSPEIFDEFSLHAIGEGQGAQSFGWGLYFTSEKAIAKWYRDLLTPIGEKSAGRLYEASIPDDDVLLNWDKAFEDQPPTVQQALTTAVEGAQLSQRGGSLYNLIARQRGGSQKASEYLASLGVKGIKYRAGGREVRGNDQASNFVVFDDKAAQIVRYEQSARSAMTETPEFKAWFAGSKVVDAEGKPLRVYHGTSKDFEYFDTNRPRTAAARPAWSGDLGSWFAAPSLYPGNYDEGNAESVASDFSGDRGVFEYVDGARVIPVYLSIKNPMEFEGFEDFQDFRGDAAKRPASEFKAKLIAKGYDGMVIRNSMTDGDVDRDDWVAFHPEQIRSAIDPTRPFEQSQRDRDALWNALTAAHEQLPARGTIDFGPDIKRQASVISLLQNADLSTFLHESGHFYLEVLTDMAGQPNAPAEIVADLHTTLKWFGVSPDEWNLMTLEEKRPYHEQWARGVESYLFEGKAPSIELQPLFARFRAWFLNVYRSLVNLNVTLTPEVRGVMDRLLATNNEITAAEDALNMAPMFEAKPAGMSDAEWLEYQKLGAAPTQDAVDNLQTRSLRDMQWASRAVGRHLAALQKDAEGKRALIRKEVSTEVNAMPVYQAMRGLRRGWKQDDGSTVNLKLNTGDLAEMYPDSMVDRPDLSKLQGMTNAETGQHPDVVASLTGFGSGDELVRKLAEAEDRTQVIEGITDQRMLERYGDLADPASIAKAADAAVHNEARARFVATELAMLDKATGQKKILAPAAKAFAATLIARKRIRDIKPAQYSSAEARAAKAAERATRADDIETAAGHKRAQLVNLYATKAAHEALTEVDKSVAYLKRVGDSKTVDPEYREQIESLLERFDLRQVTEKFEQRRQSLLQWVEDQRAKGFEPVIDEALLNEASRKPYQSMPLEEFRGLVDAVRNIEHLGRLKHTLLTLKDKREFKAVVDELVASIDSNAKRTVPTKLEHNTWLDKMKDGVSEFFAMHRKFSMMGRELDGHKDAGAFWRYLIRPMNEAGDRESVLREQATVRLQAIFEPLLDAGKLRQKMQIPGTNISLSREGRIMVALNTGNEGNLQRLLDGDHWTLEQVQAIVNTLTKPEMDFVQQVWDFIGSYRAQIGAQQKKLTGVEPEWVDSRKVTTLHGEYAGGYFPAKYDTARSTRSLADEAAQGIMDQWRGKRGVAKARDSFTKERANKVVDRPLRKDFGVLTQHVTEVTHRLAWQEYLVDANRLLRAGAVDGAIREHYGPEVLQALRNTIEDVAAGEVPAQNAFERGVSHLRHGATIAGLGWRVTTSLLQPLGITQSMVRIGPKWVAKGLAEWIGDAARMENTAKRIYEKSDMMRLRGKTMQREISEIRNQVSGESTALKASYFYLIQKMQLVADIPTWLGQYHKAVDAGADEAGAVAQADQAVLDAQGGGQLKDLAGIQRGGPLLKLFTNFYSFFNTTYNLTKESVGRTDPKSALSVGRLAVDMLLLYSVPAVLGTLMKAALHAGDDDQDERKLIRQLIADQMTYLFGTVVGLREVAGGVQGALGLAGDYQGPASVRLFSELAKLGKQVGQGEVDEALLKAAANTTGILFHLPSGQVTATLDGVATMAQGKTHNPGALVVGSTNK